MGDDSLAVQTHNDASKRLTSMLDIKVDLVDQSSSGPVRENQPC